MLSMVNQEDIAYLEMREILNIHNKSILTNLLRKNIYNSVFVKKKHTHQKTKYILSLLI